MFKIGDKVVLQRDPRHPLDIVYSSNFMKDMVAGIIGIISKMEEKTYSEERYIIYTVEGNFANRNKYEIEEQYIRLYKRLPKNYKKESAGSNV